MTSKAYQFKTLQGRLIIFLLLPVFLIIISGGVLSFLHTRNVILSQWNESAALKLERAAHYMEMRLLKPVDLLETMFKLSGKNSSPIPLKAIADHIRAMEGVLKVDFKANFSPGSPLPGYMGRHGMMAFKGSRISKISPPEYDKDTGSKSVTLVLTLMDTGGKDAGLLKIKMGFDYLLKDIIKLGWWQSDMACIVDQEGKYMAHTNMTMNGRGFLGEGKDPLEVSLLNKMETASFGTVQSLGHPPEIVAGFYKLDQVPWAIILFARGETILKPILDYRNAFALGSSLLILIILMLIRLHVGKIVNQIKSLSKNASHVARGDYGTPVRVCSPDEIGQLAESHNNMVRGLKERDFIRDSFGRYVDPEFARSLLKHPDAGKLGGRRREVVMMISDIRGFTSLSETLSPEIIIRVLNQYFSHMIAIIRDHKGIIVDFFGDSILVFFDPLSGSTSDTVLDCIRCASRMQSEMKVFNKRMKEQKLPELGVGMGINAGQVIVGNIGSPARAKYGIVGSAVNITSRIQAQAKEEEIIISESVYEYTKDKVIIEKIVSADLKGVDKPMTLRILKKESSLANF